MIAKVIVDIPVRETDRPFDYLIPETYLQLLQPGMRVTVPFGSRTLLGFVVGINSSLDVSYDKLRPIHTILDTAPVITKDLLELALWMSQKYVCPTIMALFAVIPSALKTKTDDFYTISQHDERMEHLWTAGAQEVADYVIKRGRVSEAQLIAAFTERINDVAMAVECGLITSTREVKDRLGIKMLMAVSSIIPKDDMLRMADEFRARAPKQAEVLVAIAKYEDGWLLSDLLKSTNTNASVVKSLEVKGLIRIDTREVTRDPYAHHHFPLTSSRELSSQQMSAFSSIREGILSARFCTYLLHGVTGSGKTEVYLQSIQVCLNENREAILLVPEISLTPQTVDAFKRRFGNEVAVMHSRLSQGEKYDEWRKMVKRKVRIAIGARSAIFAPFTNIGLVIIDEEHESSYKQDESPKYHARDVAIARAMKHGAVVVLGSATPSLESYYAAKHGNYAMLEMPHRVNGRPLPHVSVIDLRLELKDGNRSMFSRALQTAIASRIEREEQAVLFLNRRGYATFILCRTCGYTAQCPHCDITLTYHQSNAHARCHYCGYAERAVKTCPQCDSDQIRHFGAGTQRVEEQLVKLFPGIRTIRMDVDTTTVKGSHEKMLTAFRNHKADILIGTQMVAKGLDFPLVTLVGVLSADTMLRIPDFRAAERTFQLLTQVAGRSGRHELHGEVIVQTYTPEHYSIEYAKMHDFQGFVERELHIRKEMGYPPYCKLVLITFAYEELTRLIQVSDSFVSKLKNLLISMNRDEHLEILGPVSSPLPKLKDRYRFQCMIKYVGEPWFIDVVSEVTSLFREEIRKTNLSIHVDIEPQVLM
jgi:primosomal protein N' (replication factor Y)